jgi:hypothetical protein
MPSGHLRFAQLLFATGSYRTSKRWPAELIAAVEPTDTIGAPKFFRMLAKIAHVFTVARDRIGPVFPFPIDDDLRCGNSVRYKATTPGTCNGKGS